MHEGRHLILHLISNLLAGFSFFGISYFFLVFLIDGQVKFKNIENITIMLKKNSYLILNISLVFWLCGLGHIMEALAPWSTNTIFIEIEHWFNALAGVTLCINLTRLFNRFKKY